MPRGALIVVAASLVASFIYIAGRDLRTGEYWDCYYTIITGQSGPVEKMLEDRGLSYISLSKSRVIYNDIPEIASLPLRDVSSRFDDDDPRFDPYLRKVSGLFEGVLNDELLELLYVEKEGLSPFLLFFYLRELFSESEEKWAIGGFSPFRFLLPLLFYIFSSAILFLLNREGRFLSFTGAAAWLPFVFLYGYTGIITALAVHSLFSLDHRRTLPFFIAGFAAFLVEPGSGIGEFLLYILLLVLGISGSLLPYIGKEEKREYQGIQTSNKRKMRFSKPEHRLFEPVRIMDKPQVQRNSPARTVPGLVALFLFILSTYILSLFDSGTPTALLPVPGSRADRRWTLSGIQETFGKDGVISPADYLTHRAYQEGFLYRSSWVYPSPSDPLLYPVYTTEGVSVSKTYEIIADYNETWFRNQISLLKNDNPASLLFSTEGPVVVEKKSDQPISGGFSLLNFSHFMLILLLLYFSNRNNTLNTSFSVRKKLLRRNEQVA